MLLSYISELPNVLVDIISNYIPKLTLSLLNKQYFLSYFNRNQLYLENKYEFKYPHYNGGKNKNKSYDSYIRYIIRSDSSFIFENIVTMNYKKWKKTKKYYYRNIKFRNYLEYILYLCELHTSGKCKNIIKYTFKYN